MQTILLPVTIPMDPSKPRVIASNTQITCSNFGRIDRIRIGIIDEREAAAEPELQRF
jgi:hypothetical protein